MHGPRIVSLSALVLVVFLPFSSQAQRGGGARAMGGGGHVGSARSGAPARTGVAPTRVGVAHARVAPVSSRGMFARPANHTNHLIVSSGHFHHFHNNHFVFRSCFGFSCNNPFLFGAGLGFWGYPGYDPFYSDSYAPSAPEQPAASDETSATDVQLAVEMQRLADQVEELRDQQRAPQPVMKTITPQGSLSAQPPADSTTFVFRDGRRIVTQNFAIVDHTLWILSQHTAKKVPLTDLDRTATEQANAANGVEFHLP